MASLAMIRDIMSRKYRRCRRRMRYEPLRFAPKRCHARFRRYDFLARRDISIGRTRASVTRYRLRLVTTFRRALAARRIQAHASRDRYSNSD